MSSCEGLSAIRLQSLWPQGCHPQRLLGRFRGDELVFTTAPDLGLSWERKPSESPEAYERRIVDDIRIADTFRHSPPPRRRR